ncbi:hypothetical protein [Thalassotalea sp. PLHSN55]|uniref:hypothetical protein n=1 Tax=Thalassotalea sp. PLHSN55 TaxID=3435888 RepID=UPI003F839F7F
MKIAIENGLTEYDSSMEEHIQRKLRLALSKMAANISTITFTINEVVDQQGQVEKHCLLLLSLYQMPNIAIEETQADLAFVIDRVIQKATRALSRKLSV